MLLGQQHAGRHVAHVDVGEPAPHGEPQQAAQVLLDRPGRDAVHVARPDHEAGVDDHHVEAVGGRLAARAARPAPSSARSGSRRGRRRRPAGSGPRCGDGRASSRAHRAHAGGVDDALDAGGCRRLQQVLAPTTLTCCSRSSSEARWPTTPARWNTRLTPSSAGASVSGWVTSPSTVMAPVPDSRCSASHGGSARAPRGPGRAAAAPSPRPGSRRPGDEGQHPG